MSTTRGTRARVALASLGAVGLALAVATPAIAAGGTPATPTQLFNGLRNCSTDPAAPSFLDGRGNITLEGVAQEADAPAYQRVAEQFRLWPVSDPTQVTTLSNSSVLVGNAGSVIVPSAAVADGQTYAWQAQVTDGGVASDWSATCYYTVDGTPPAQAPVVSSANYPQGGWDQGGAPVQFTLDAAGVGDVAGFEYSWNDLTAPVLAHTGPGGIPQINDPYSDFPDTFVRATTLGGKATLSLMPPRGSGPVTLQVRSLDRAFNISETTRYQFFIKPSVPSVTTPVPAPQFDEPTPFKFTPDPALQAVSPVVSYTVRIQAGPNSRTVTVPAGGNGQGELNIRLNGAYGTDINVSSTSANGWVSGEGQWRTGYLDSTPTVSSDVYLENGTSGGVGVAGSFTFAPKVKGVASYTYSFNGGPATTVSAGDGGTATISWTPTTSDYQDLTVYATTGDGIVLSSYDYGFWVN
ncbi:hypothetical protein [Kitasatospora azatica]|uniref:hypothetical protein n=1 Tax=Kitasatospora azatica TaxID=58347 RepID=UPI00056D06B2|nr:hypothetical protein [Kitasatospora azatica]